VKIYTLGADSAIARGVKISNNVAIGAGSTAIKDVKDITKFI
jgi:acetyltransferase-like isoleucine patch superfamily enzyme